MGKLLVHGREGILDSYPSRNVLLRLEWRDNYQHISFVFTESSGNHLPFLLLCECQ